MISKQLWWSDRCRHQRSRAGMPGPWAQETYCSWVCSPKMVRRREGERRPPAVLPSLTRWRTIGKILRLSHLLTVGQSEVTLSLARPSTQNLREGAPPQKQQRIGVWETIQLGQGLWENLIWSTDFQILTFLHGSPCPVLRGDHSSFPTKG